MSRIEILKTNQYKLMQRYKILMERAYNFQQTDGAISDISEYKAMKLLDKLNRLKYLVRDTK